MFEELSIIFAPAVVDIVMISSDEEPCADKRNNGKGKGKKTIRGKTLEAGGPSNQAPSIYLPDMNVPSTQGPLSSPNCFLPLADGPRKYPRYIEFPMEIAPANNATHPPFKMVPLNLYVEPINSSGTPPFNIWDYINYFSDNESGGTDVSTANSYNCGARGFRSTLDRKKTGSNKTRISITDSNSPFSKRLDKKK